MRKLLFVSLALLSASSCEVVIPDITICTAAGVLAAGADCVTTQSGGESEMTRDEYKLFLEADVQAGRGGAICMSTSDYERQHVAIEQACRALGKKCKREVREALENAAQPLVP